MKINDYSNEEWVPLIIKYPRTNTQYLISTYGRLKNVKTKQLLTPIIKNERKFYATNCFGIKSALNLMARSFFPEKVNVMEDQGIVWHADHLDNDRSNDTLKNINIISASENSIKANKLRKYKKNNYNYKIVQIDPNNNQVINTYLSVQQAAHSHNVSRHQIFNHIKNSNLKLNGYIWKKVFDTIDGEIWYDCKLPQFKGLKYSNLGRVESQRSARNYGYLNINKYYEITINRKSWRVHRIIAMECYPSEYKECKSRCENKEEPQVDHINRISTDNRPENLRWVTRIENMQNVIRKVKPVIAINIETKVIKIWDSIADASREINIQDSLIIKVCKGKGTVSAGYIWRYYNVNNNINMYDILENYLNDLDFKKTSSILAFNYKTLTKTIYKNINEAVKQTGCNRSSILRCCKNNQKTTKDYIFKFEFDWNETIEHEILNNLNNIAPLTMGKSVVGIHIKDNIIQIFDTMSLASKATGCSRSGIIDCCKRRLKTTNGYKWSYLNDYNATISS